MDKQSALAELAKRATREASTMYDLIQRTPEEMLAQDALLLMNTSSAFSGVWLDESWQTTVAKVLHPSTPAPTVSVVRSFPTSTTPSEPVEFEGDDENEYA